MQPMLFMKEKIIVVRTRSCYLLMQSAGIPSAITKELELCDACVPDSPLGTTQLPS